MTEYLEVHTTPINSNATPLCETYAPAELNFACMTLIASSRLIINANQAANVRMTYSGSVTPKIIDTIVPARVKIKGRINDL